MRTSVNQNPHQESLKTMEEQVSQEQVRETQGKERLSVSWVWLIFSERHTRWKEVNLWCGRWYGLEKSLLMTQASRLPPSHLHVRIKQTTNAQARKNTRFVCPFKSLFADFRFNPDSQDKAHPEKRSQLTSHYLTCHFEHISKLSCFWATKI